MNKEKMIQQLLDAIESEHNITIIHAIESGSRAWGFPSIDSDYDIRFIYHHRKDWYLSAFERKDVIDLAIDADLDAGGWDIGKCMRLLYKGNAPLYEWLYSPVVYKQQGNKLNPLRELAVEAFNPKVAFYHYMSLAKKKLHDDKTPNHAKSFLYALRALLCAKWVAEDATVPSVDVWPLINRYMTQGELYAAISRLIDDKAKEVEKYSKPIAESLMDYANALYRELQDVEPKAKRLKAKDRYDRVMRDIILSGVA